MDNVNAVGSLCSKDPHCYEGIPCPHHVEREFRLWDSQWVNVVNHEHAYAHVDKDEAIAIAVRLTEEAMARNIRDNSFPPPRARSTATGEVA